MTQKIVVNRCFGGFGLSHKAKEYYLNLKGKKAYFYTQTKHSYRDGCNEYRRVSASSSNLFTHTLTIDAGETTNDIPQDNYFYYGNIKRDDKHLIETIEALGKEANSDFSELEIVEIPDDVKWQIEEYDGIEWVAEEHRTW